MLVQLCGPVWPVTCLVLVCQKAQPHLVSSPDLGSKEGQTHSNQLTFPPQRFLGPVGGGLPVLTLLPWALQDSPSWVWSLSGLKENHPCLGNLA